MDSYVPIIFHLKEIASLFKRTGKFAATLEDCYPCKAPTDDTVYEESEKSRSQKSSPLREPFQPITCCGFRLKSKFTYQRHTESVYHVTRLERVCSVCAKYFPSKRELATHLKHCSPSHKCQECGTSFVDKVLLAQHMKHTHISSFTLKCDKCSYVTWKGSSLYAHKARCQLQLARKSRNGFEPTECCGRTFKYSSHLKRHRDYSCRLTHKVKHLCKICDEYFEGKEALQQHTKNAHAEWKCMICNATFPTKGNLTVHLKSVHIKSTTFECSKCPFSTARKDRLSRHFQICHPDQKLPSFSCEFCPHKFYRKDHLEMHRKRHLKNTHPCVNCSLSFISVEDLEKHKLVHRPCQICGMKFKLLKQRESHLNKHLTGRLKKSRTSLRNKIEPNILD